MFQCKIKHGIGYTKEKLFRVNLANSELCYLCLKTKQDLKHMLDSLVSDRLGVLGSFPELVQVSRINGSGTINH